MSLRNSDTLAGLFFIIVGASFGLSAFNGLAIGHAGRMGPGFVPLILAGITAALGLAVLLRSLGGAGDRFQFDGGRGLVMVTASLVLFGATIRSTGMVPALAASVFLASFASRRMTLPSAAKTTLFVVIFCVVVFKMMLGLPVRLFADFLTF